jgi:hypothetical protein
MEVVVTQKVLEPELRRREPATHEAVRSAYEQADMYAVFARLAKQPAKRPETCGA